jgi:hypothetical protein
MIARGAPARVPAIALALLALPTLPACRSHRPMDTHPGLVIDTAFTSAEMAQVMDAVAAWEAIGPDVRFAVTEADHAAVGRAGATSPDDDTIYLQRRTEGGCAIALGAYAGLTVWSNTTSTQTCVDAGELDADGASRPRELQAVVAHELGHSLGLWHIDVGLPDHPVSIMTTWHQDEPLDGLPTCLDSNDVADVHHLARTGACR